MSTERQIQEAVARGLAQSAAGETVDLGDFTQYVVSDAAVEAFKAAWHHTDAEGRSGERVRDGLAAALPFLGAAPSATREEVGESLHPGLFSLSDYEYARRFDNHGAEARARHQEAVLADEVDPLLARFTIVPR